MAKKKTKKVDQKWLVLGLVVLILGMWWGIQSVRQAAKVAEVSQTSLVEYARLDDWKFGTLYVKKGELAASKKWSYTQRYQEDSELLRVSVGKKKNLCMTYKMSKESDYDSSKIFSFRLSGVIRPSGIKTEPGQQLGQVGTRKWTATFLNKQKKALAYGEQKMAVMAPVAIQGDPAKEVEDRDESGSQGGGTLTEEQIVVEIGPKDDMGDVQALKMAYIQLCLDQSSSENVDVELSQLEWLLDSRYLGPADQVNNYMIVQ